MGISPSTFNNLPVMTNQELQQQIRAELAKAAADKKNPKVGAAMYDYAGVKVNQQFA